MSWLDQLNGDSLTWLLEPDLINPGPRYFALRDILGKSSTDPELLSAREAVMNHGPVPVILANQHPDGYWIKPGPGYSPKYGATTWQIIQLAMFGADGNHPKIRTGCEYVLSHARSDLGGFSLTGTRSGMLHCFQGNMLASLIDLGYYEDERVRTALNWLARSITGEGIAPNTETSANERYYLSGNSAPGFACAYNNQLPCAWGAVRSLLALCKVPPENRDGDIAAAIQTGVDFIFSRNPVKADYPMGYSQKPNSSWFHFGLPIGYACDMLQILEVMSQLGHGRDARLQTALDFLIRKQDQDGRWVMGYSPNRKTLTDIETKGKPSKWVTLRALRVISRVFQAE